jgi:hypothetical protein
MDVILKEIEHALKIRLFYTAIVMCLTLPDICAALAHTAALGRTSPGLLRKIRPILLHNPAHDFRVRASGTRR